MGGQRQGQPDKEHGKGGTVDHVNCLDLWRRRYVPQPVMRAGTAVLAGVNLWQLLAKSRRFGNLHI